MESFMTPVSASTLPGSVLRYGNPVFDCDGAWIRALSRQLATVVTVGGAISADNIDRLTELVRPFVIDEKPFVLDLSGVTSVAGHAGQLLDAVSDSCEKAGVEWAVVAGDTVCRLLSGSRPVVGSVPEALERFAAAIQWRRTMMMPLLGRKLTKSA